MFFPELIKSIKPTNRVLEIGPGGTPYSRSDIFLEITIKDKKIAKLQRGNTEKLITNKPVIYYEGKRFPFSDNEFDYVICSHVLEHIEDIEFFISELFRIAPRGYIEYPTIYYEYLYNIPVHLNFLKFKNNTLFYLKKTNTHFFEFWPVQKFFFESLNKGYSKIIEDLKEFLFEGFEWLTPFSIKKTNSINDLIFDKFFIDKFFINPSKEIKTSQKTEGLIIKKIKNVFFKNK